LALWSSDIARFFGAFFVGVAIAIILSTNVGGLLNLVEFFGREVS